MLAGLFNNTSESEKNKAIEDIIERATPRQDFFLMLTLSVAMAAFGILLNSTVILVGSMLIAPLLYPILSLALGIIVADEKLIGRSVLTILKSIGFAIAAAFILGFLFSAQDAGSLPLLISEVPSPLMYAVVAVIAGLAGAFATIKPNLNETLPGVAIAVALVPPLAAAGIALSTFEWRVFSDALLLFIVNVVGIVFSAMIVFALFRFATKKTVTTEAVKEEEKEMAKEKTKSASESDDKA